MEIKLSNTIKMSILVFVYALVVQLLMYGDKLPTLLILYDSILTALLSAITFYFTSKNIPLPPIEKK